MTTADGDAPITLGILADTHVPDRASYLHPQILPIFRAAEVMAILHAGDISAPQVLDELRRVAPVYAVRGNRDWLRLGNLPRAFELEFHGVRLVLTHGHGHWWQYALDRVHVILFGYRLELFLPRLLRKYPEVPIIIFGHIHRQVNQRINGQLVFNPGSPHFSDEPGVPTSIGLVTIFPNGQVEARHIPLPAL